MKAAIAITITVLVFAALLFLIPKEDSLFAAVPEPPGTEPATPGSTETAVFAGGCFWGVEGVFERLSGVIDVESGYAGGEARTAHYKTVSTGTTGHAESVRVTFDPAIVDYGTLLKVFFFVAHDPTQLNRQGPDRGTQYRSAIFYTSAEQKRIAGEYIGIIDKAGVFERGIVTRVVPFEAFYPAEDYHQDFMEKNPDYPYIVFWDLPKVKRLETEFPGLVKKR
ncbi:MAG: peptide-methionine (S)-S-oxide reductase MsrA [Spirochaetales bacterium]|nr:peptide-methionine (S)-S-oxide reductase MsrA [Spirochaetales bacterium]